MHHNPPLHSLQVPAGPLGIFLASGYDMILGEGRARVGCLEFPTNISAAAAVGYGERGVPPPPKKILCDGDILGLFFFREVWGLNNLKSITKGEKKKNFSGSNFSIIACEGKEENKGQAKFEFFFSFFLWQSTIKRIRIQI